MGTKSDFFFANRDHYLLSAVLWAFATFALSPLGAKTGVDTKEMKQALELQIKEIDGTIEVAVIGHSEIVTDVEYDLSVTGSSSTRHKGRTRLSGAANQVLSKVRINAGDDWCAVLVAKQEGGESYNLTRGSTDNCAR